MTAGVRSAAAFERERVEQLLLASQLPLQGVDEHFASFLVAELDGEIAAAAGLELHDQDGLLRSVVVALPYRRRGIAERLVRAQIAAAERQRLRALYLLTTDADSYFTRFGFELIERAHVPPAVKCSDEFVSACPASARAMSLALGHPR